jgi:hypothetical protein
MAKNTYNKTITIGRQKLNALMNWAYNYGKNDGGETAFKRDRDEKIEELK